MERSLLRQNNRLAILGVILMIPALLLVLGGVLQSLLGVTEMNEVLNFELFIFHPVVLLGGVMAALGMNLLSVVRVKFQDGTLLGTLRIRGRLFNLGLIALTGMVLAIIFTYLLVENFQIIANFH